MVLMQKAPFQAAEMANLQLILWCVPWLTTIGRMLTSTLPLGTNQGK